MSSDKNQFMLQLASNLQALEQAGDWIGKRLLVGRYGAERCELANQALQNHQGVPPPPNCEVQPSGADAWEFLKEEFELDLDTALGCAQTGLAQAFEHGINLIDQNCGQNLA